MHQITAVIPTYNRATLLRRALDSALQQTWAPGQVLVVDDGSTDDTGEICRAYGDAIEYVRQDNAGASVARNLGTSLARHPWIAFLDSDDFWTSSHLARMHSAIEQTSGAADLYFADMEMPAEDGGGTLWHQIGFQPDAPHQLISDASAWALLKRQPMMLQAAVIRRAALIQLGGLDPRFRLVHDSHVFCRLSIGRPACAVAGVGCVQTGDDGSDVRLTRSVPLDSEGKARESCAMWELLYRDTAISGNTRRMLRYNAAASRWEVAKYDLRAGSYIRAAGGMARAVATDPPLGWRLAVKGLVKTVGNVLGTTRNER